MYKLITSIMICMLIISNLIIYSDFQVLQDQNKQIMLDVYMLNEKVYISKKTDSAKFLYAIIENDIGLFDELIGQIDINQINEQGGNFLETAVANERLYMVEQLVKTGVFINTVDPVEGTTVFHLAAYVGNKDIMNALLKSSFKPMLGIKDNTGKTAIQIAKERNNVNGFDNQYVIDLLRATEKQDE